MEPASLPAARLPTNTPSQEPIPYERTLPTPKGDSRQHLRVSLLLRPPWLSPSLPPVQTRLAWQSTSQRQLPVEHNHTFHSSGASVTALPAQEIQSCTSMSRPGHTV